MKGYSWSKEDFVDLLIKKYQMKEAIFIEGDGCYRCRSIKPVIEKRAKENWYEFQVFRFDDVAVKEFDIQAVPMLVFRQDGVVSEILNEEQIVNLVSNKQ